MRRAAAAAGRSARAQEALLAALRFRAFPEVPDVLRALRARGARLVVVSNWDASLHEVLPRTGLAALVDGAVASAELGVAKPDPAIFVAGLALAGVRRPGRCTRATTCGPTSPGPGPRASGGARGPRRRREPPPGVPAVATLDGLLTSTYAGPTAG